MFNLFLRCSTVNFLSNKTFPILDQMHNTSHWPAFDEAPIRSSWRIEKTMRMSDREVRK